jgi:hypothetical protein
MEICLRVLGHIEVDHNVDGKDVDSSGENVCADEASGFSIFEVVVDPKKKEVKWIGGNLPISVSLLHFGMNVEATVA